MIEFENSINFDVKEFKKLEFQYLEDDYYFEFLNTTDNIACLKALKRIYPRINMDKINAIIESTPYISGIQKDFYRTMLAQRKAKILDSAIKRGERK